MSAERPKTAKIGLGANAAVPNGGITEVGCMAHARRKFVELHLANKSTLAATAIDIMGELYGIERGVKLMSPDERVRERRTRAAPIAGKPGGQALPGKLRAPLSALP